MRLLVLGGTHFLGRHVATAALDARPRRRDLHPRRLRRPAGGRPGAARRPQRPRRAARRRSTAGRPSSSSTRPARPGPPPATPPPCSATSAATRSSAASTPTRTGRPGPIGPEDDEPTWTTDDDEYGPNKAFAEREIGAAVGDGFLTARAGLIVGPHDPIYRLGWWLDRIARGGRVVVPEALDQPIALVDARDLAGWLVEMAEQGRGGGGQRDRAGRHDHARRAARRLPRGHRQRRRVGAGARGGAARAGVEPWVHLPLWLPQEIARTAWDVDTTRARELGLPSRPLRRLGGRHLGLAAGAPSARRCRRRTGPSPGLPPELEAQLLAAR